MNIRGIGMGERVFFKLGKGAKTGEELETKSFFYIGRGEYISTVGGGQIIFLDRRTKTGTLCML